MLTVNITGSATGTALISSTSSSGTISSSGTPRASDSSATTASNAPTMTNSQRTTPRDHVLDVQLRLRALHELGRAPEVGRARR